MFYHFKPEWGDLVGRMWQTSQQGRKVRVRSIAGKAKAIWLPAVTSASSGIKGKIHKYFKMFALYCSANWSNETPTYKGK